MRKIIFTISAVLIVSLQTWGQNDNYSNVHEAIGQTIQIYDLDQLFNEYGAFIYTKNHKGKLVKNKEISTYTQIHNKHLKVIDIEIIKKKSYLTINCQEDIFYFLIDNIDYCENIRSVSYWEKEYQNYSETYSHYLPKGAHGDKLESYKPIVWLGYLMPSEFHKQPTFNFEISKDSVIRVIPADIMAENGFISAVTYKQIKADIEEQQRIEAERKKIEQERRDSIADYSRIIQVKINQGDAAYKAFEKNGVFADAPKFSHIDNLFSWYKPSKYTKYCMAKEWDYYITIYSMNPIDGSFEGYCKGKEIIIPRAAISGLESKDAQFLSRRFATGNKGKEIRRITAQNFDKSFYSSPDEHLKIISSLDPDETTYSKDERIGNNYVLKHDILERCEFYVLGTGKRITNKYAGQVFTLIDIVDDPTINDYPLESVILYNNKFGYCFTSTVNFELNFVEQKTAIKNQQKRKEWEKRMIEKYGEINGKTIIEGKVRVGFTAEMCRDSWGKPSDINRTTTAHGVHEQWVYGYGNYLYFEDGILTAIQN